MTLLKVTLADVGVLLIAVSMVLIVGAIVLAPVSIYVPAYELEKQVIDSLPWHAQHPYWADKSLPSTSNIDTGLYSMYNELDHVRTLAEQSGMVEGYVAIELGLAYNSTANIDYNLLWAQLDFIASTFDPVGYTGGGIETITVPAPYPGPQENQQDNESVIASNTLLILYYTGNLFGTGKPVLVLPGEGNYTFAERIASRIGATVVQVSNISSSEIINMTNLTTMITSFWPTHTNMPLLLLPATKPPTTLGIEDARIIYTMKPAIVVKLDPDKIEFNPLSGDIASILASTAESVFPGYTFFSNPAISQALPGVGGDVIGLAAVSGVTVFIFVVSLVVVLPYTAQALAGRMKRTFAELRVRGADSSMLKRHLLKAVLIAAFAGSLGGYLISHIFAMIFYGGTLYDRLANAIFMDRFTLASILVATIVAALLYWRRLYKEVLGIPYTYALRPLEAVSAEPPKIGKGTFLVFGISLYHIVRLLIGWSAIRTLTTGGGDYPVLLLVALFVLALIEFLTTPFTPIMLAYSISKIIAARIDIVGRVLSRSRRILGDMVSTAQGIAKLMLPSLIGLAAVVILAFTLSMPGISTASIADSSGYAAVTPSLGAPYAMVAENDTIVDAGDLQEYIGNISAEAPPGSIPVVLITYQTDLLATVQAEGSLSYYGNQDLPTGMPIRTIVAVLDIEGYTSSAPSYFDVPLAQGSWPSSLVKTGRDGKVIVSILGVENRIGVHSIEGVYTLWGPEEIAGVYYWAPGQAFIDVKPDTVVLVSGPWIVERIEESLPPVASLRLTTIYLSFEEPMSTPNGYTLYVAHELENKDMFEIGLGVFKMGLGADTMLIVTTALLILLAVITALLVSSAVREVDPVFRLLRLRGAGFKESTRTILAPWLAVTLLAALSGVIAGLSLLMMNLRIMEGRSTMGFIRIPDYTLVDGVKIYWYLGASQQTLQAILYPLVVSLVVTFLIIIAPLLYMARIYRGTGPTTYRRGI